MSVSMCDWLVLLHRLWRQYSFWHPRIKRIIFHPRNASFKYLYLDKLCFTVYNIFFFKFYISHFSPGSCAGYHYFILIFSFRFNFRLGLWTERLHIHQSIAAFLKLCSVEPLGTVNSTRGFRDTARTAPLPSTDQSPQHGSRYVIKPKQLLKKIT